jgi:hypothetical protein
MSEIPPGQYKYDMFVQFVTWPKDDGTWHLFGPVHLMRIGDVAEVKKFDGSTDYVEVLEHVAWRDVKKRDGNKIKFVIATFDRTAEEATIDDSTERRT